jgi:hypothetical protein
MRMLHDALDALREEASAGRPAAAIGLDLVEMERSSGRLLFELSRRCADFDAAGGALADGVPSAAAWLRTRTMMAPGEASMLVRVGRDLRDRLPATAAAARDGLISFGAAMSISASLRPVADRGLLAQADIMLAGQAPDLTRRELIYAGRRVLQHLDPQTAQRCARQSWADRSLTLSPMLDGAVSIQGQLTAEGAAVLQSALAPMTTPLGPGGRPHRRPAPGRRIGRAGRQSRRERPRRGRRRHRLAADPARAGRHPGPDGPGPRRRPEPPGRTTTVRSRAFS